MTNKQEFSEVATKSGQDVAFTEASEPAPGVPSSPMPRGGAFFRSKWEQERAMRLHRVFTRAELLKSHGVSLGKTFRRFVAYYARKPRHYRSEVTQQVRFSRSLLHREFRRWKEGGRVPEALTLNYFAPWRRIGPREVEAFALACLRPEIRNLKQGFRALSAPKGTYEGFVKATPSDCWRKLQLVFEARRKSAWAEKRAARAIAALTGGFK